MQMDQIGPFATAACTCAVTFTPFSSTTVRFVAHFTFSWTDFVGAEVVAQELALDERHARHPVLRFAHCVCIIVPLLASNSRSVIVGSYDRR